MLHKNEITSFNERKLLGILLDSKLYFESHFCSLAEKQDNNKCSSQIKELPYTRSRKLTN